MWSFHSNGERVAMAQLTISLLGPFQVALNGAAVTQFGSDTARALLVYLVMHPGVAHRRDVLAGLLWPELSNAAALRNLRVALSRLRNAIDDRDANTPLLDATPQTIQYTGDSRCRLDVQAMREALASIKAHDHAQLDECGQCAKQFQAVADLYRGDFLAGFALDSAPFEAWIVVERENYHWQALEALYTLTSYHEKQGNFEAAINGARRQVELEPWHESAHRQWMRVLALSGHRGAALVQYETCRQVLAEELGVEPEAETVALVGQIRDGVLALPPHNLAAERAAVVPPIEAGSLTISPVMVKEPAIPPPQFESPPFPEGERRTVTIVQAKVGGSESLLVRVGAEDWAATVSQLLRAIGIEIRRYGGEVDHYDENGFVAFFGAQAAHEDDPERGVLAALATQQAFGAQLTHLTDEVASLDDLSLRIGVHTGEVIVTVVEGSGGAGHRMVIGDVFSSANRLLAQAASGEVRVSEETYRLVEPLFKWASQDSTGGHTPLAHKLHTGKGRGLPGMYSDLVGRQRELGILQDAVTRLQSGVGGIVTLVGEAGIGKSRLVAEVRDAADLLWVEGHCLSYGETIAYGLWQDVLRALLGVTMDTPPAITDHALRAHVRALDAERFEASYAYLGRLLALPLPPDAQAMIAQMDAGNLQSGIFYAVERFLESAAQRQPLVIVCEDLHWADPTSLALLERLLALTDRVPLLFICVFRPRREHGCWHVRETALRTYPHRHIGVQLEPLTIAEGEMLVTNLLLSLPGPDDRKPVEGLPETLKKHILSRGGGNPFYVEEILRALIRSGAIVCHESSCRWETEQKVEEIGIPETLYGVLRSRIDQLPAGARHVLHLASVIGRIFPRPLLADIAERDGLDEHLVTLQREQMIRERARLPEAEFIFQHQLTLEVAYDGLLTRVRRVLHRRVAQAVERLYPGGVEEQLGLLAYHWEQAGETEQAVSYLRRAGEQAAAQYANAEAVDYLSRALTLLPHDDLPGQYALLCLREAVYFLQGVREAQREDLSQLKEIAAAMDDGGREAARRRAEVALREVSHFYHAGNQAPLFDAARKAVRLAQAAGDASLEAEGHLQLGSVLFNSWDLDGGREHWKKALAFVRAVGNRPLEAQVLRELGLAVFEIGRFDEARNYLEQNLQIHRESGNRLEEGKALNALALIVMGLHDLAQAKAHAENGLQLCRLTGNRYDEAWALCMLGEIQSRLGQYDEGVRRLQEALRLFSPAGVTLVECRIVLSQGWFAHSAGDDDACLDHSKRALNLADAIKFLPFRALASISLGDALAGKGCWSDAYKAYQEVLTLCQDQAWHQWDVSARAGLARIALSRDELQEALAHVREILGVVETWPELDGAWDPMRVYGTCYRVLRAVGDLRAKDVLQTAYRLLQGWAAKIDDKTLRRSYLENVPENREIVAEYEQVHP